MRNKGGTMKVTISDVARLAGVSTATVSHTINSTRYVSEETREKVYRAIAELGYTPDASARSFRTGKKRTIGFIVPDISNKFFSTMIESVENYLSAHGYHLIIANTKENAEREETQERQFQMLVWVEPIDFTSDLPSRLHALYTQ